MDTAEVIQQARALSTRIANYRAGSGGTYAAKAQTVEFLKQTAGAKSAFVKQAEAVDGAPVYAIPALQSIVQSYVQYLEAGLATGVSPERQAQIDVVSDILGQAQLMLDSKGYHPAAAAVLIGASLEEFLRNWVEATDLSIGSSKPGMDSYCKALRTAELITKQDAKDITAWAGTRNHAAHGEWDEVSDTRRIRLMLDGVNLFMRQNAANAASASA